MPAVFACTVMSDEKPTKSREELLDAALEARRLAKLVPADMRRRMIKLAEEYESAAANATQTRD